MIIISVENGSYFCGNRHLFYFSGFIDEYKVQKNSIYLKYNHL